MQRQTVQYHAGMTRIAKMMHASLLTTTKRKGNSASTKADVEPDKKAPKKNVEC